MPRLNQTTLMMLDQDLVQGRELILHVLLNERLSIEVLVEVHLRVLRRKRVVCADRIKLIILLFGNVEVMGGVVGCFLSNVRILNREIGNTGR